MGPRRARRTELAAPVRSVLACGRQGPQRGQGVAESFRRGFVLQHWNDPESVVIEGREPATLLRARSPALEPLNDVQRMMALDTLTYLPDDILVKVDRAAMRVSLESRAPYLDHRVVDLAWRLPARAHPRAAWLEHLSGQRNLAHYFWDVLMFQAWLEAQSPAKKV